MGSIGIDTYYITIYIHEHSVGTLEFGQKFKNKNLKITFELHNITRFTRVVSLHNNTIKYLLFIVYPFFPLFFMVGTLSI